MLWLPIVFLTLTMLVIGTAFALMFCSVAFAGWSSGFARQASAGWEVPALSGDRLRPWAANLARRVVARHTHQPRSAETALAIAAELEAGANAALEQAAQETQVVVAKTCPNGRPKQVGVTAPEVFAITNELERSYPKSELPLISEIAVLNARRAQFLHADEFPQAGIGCPLRTKDGHCLTFTSRPIACRRLCSDGCGCCDNRNEQSSSTSCSVVEHLHEGMTRGLSEGLRLAGLDGETYELNAALATALATPHAAARWARGEAIFASCAKA